MTREAFAPLALAVAATPLFLIAPSAPREPMMSATLARPPPRVALYLDKHALLR